MSERRPELRTAAIDSLAGRRALTRQCNPSAERWTCEIGIRKVLGARTADIMRLLVRQFSLPVSTASIIAQPVAFWLMREAPGCWPRGSPPSPSSVMP